MSPSREQPTDPGETRASRAEALLRSLTGILDARVEIDAGGAISRVALLARQGITTRVAVRNAQSALLASLGLSIDADRVAVDLAEPGAVEPWRAPAAAVRSDGAPPAEPPPAARNGTGQPTPGPRKDEPKGGTRAAPHHRNGNGSAYAIPDHARAPEIAPDADAIPVQARHAHGLVRVDIVPGPAGQVRVRVVLALDDRINVGEADGIDSPTSRLELAARALLRAVPARYDRELEGIRTLDIGGRSYIVAAVRTVRGRTIDYHADAMPVDGSAEHAAAMATLGAVIG